MMCFKYLKNLLQFRLRENWNCLGRTLDTIINILNSYWSTGRNDYGHWNLFLPGAEHSTRCSPAVKPIGGGACLWREYETVFCREAAGANVGIACAKTCVADGADAGVFGNAWEGRRRTVVGSP